MLIFMVNTGKDLNHFDLPDHGLSVRLGPVRISLEKNFRPDSDFSDQNPYQNPDQLISDPKSGAHTDIQTGPAVHALDFEHLMAPINDGAILKNL